MDHQTELIHLASQQSLSKLQFNQLQALATPYPAPSLSDYWLRRGLFMVAALCLGLAVIFGIAANWNALSTFQRFAIVEAALVASLLAGCVPSRIRPAALFLSVLVLGGLLALYAQVYSTNSGPWRLFAIWAAMALPIALAARHQAVWIVWVFIVLLATSLWLTQTHSSRYDPKTMQTLVSWLVLATLSLALYPRGWLQAWLGSASHLAFRWAVCCGIIFMSFTAVTMLFNNATWPLLLALAALAGIWYGLWALRYADVSITALCALCMDALIITLALRVLADVHSLGTGGWIVMTLLLGGVSVALLTFSVKLIRKTQQSLQPLSVDTPPPSAGSAI